jgi:nitroreductase
MEVLQAITERRSINFFDPEATLPEETLHKLLELANLAPSSMNLQPWKVIVVRSLERKKALRALAFNQPKVEEAAVVLIMVADPAAVEENLPAVYAKNVELGYAKPDTLGNTRSMAQNLYSAPTSLRRTIFAVKNTGLYAMSIMIAARGLGLETHPMDGFNEDQVKQEFGIPERCLVPMLIAVGNLKPGTKLLPRAYRRKIADFVSFE